MTDILLEWHAQLMNPDRIPLVLSAMLLTAIIGMVTGPLAGNANPLIWLIFDKIFGKFGDRLDRLKRQRADLIFRSFLFTALILFVVMAAGKGLSYITQEEPAFGFSEILFLSAMISTGAVWFALLRLYFAQEKGDTPPGAYYAISRSTRSNLVMSDDYAITRAGMGFAVRSMDKGLVAPVFWYLIGGLPVALVYTALAAMAWRFGKDGFTKGFGTVPLTLEKLMGFVPGLLSAFLVTMASVFTPTAAIHKSVLSFLGHKNRASYAQGGLPLSALAWTLNVSLGGASQDLSGSAIQGRWVGPDGATAQNDHRHLRRALYINITAHILFVATLLGAYVWSGRGF